MVIKNICAAFGLKVLFDGFSASVPYGSKIALIGRNGAGKTALIKILAGLAEPAEGEVFFDPASTRAYVPQTVEDHHELSGGQRFNKALSAALAQNPDILLLDEPTNHLDKQNRASLMQMLKRFEGTLIVVSHDSELLNNLVQTLWHIDGGEVKIFNGNFDNYMAEIKNLRRSLEGELEELSKEKKSAHKALMREQARAKNSRAHGEKAAQTGKWVPIIAGGMKRAAQNTAGAKNKNLRARREDLAHKISSLYIPEIIIPKFSITAGLAERSTILSVTNGSAAYGEKTVLQNINLSLTGTERMALTGNNGSGKTTLVRAIMQDAAVSTTGDWFLPKRADIGYLDQHYTPLPPEQTALQIIQAALPARTHAEMRDFLNNFLFRKQEEVNTPAAHLSGGEKARLSLALIAARTPKLLILDEVTNNVDFETKEHIIQVLRAYPAALIVISHEQSFLDEINIEKYVNLK